MILRLTPEGQIETLAHIESAHQNDITQVLALTDNKSYLSFVTVSLDTYIKIYSFEGELEGESLADGQIITATTVPGKKDYFIVSTFNEES